MADYVISGDLTLEDVVIDGDITIFGNGSTGGTSIILAAYQGWSATLNKNVDYSTLKDCLDGLINLSYAAPTVTLSASPAQTLREKGDVVSSASLSAVTTKRSDNITSVAFYRGASSIHGVSSPNASGGTETYTDNTDFSDTTSYHVVVSDGTQSPTSNTITYSFVYPYYYGVGALGLTAAQVALLTKSIIAETSSKSVTTSPSNQVFYFAYPAAYGALTSILDASGLETITDYIQRTENITGLDGSPQSYFIYELDHAVTVSNFTNTYKL